MTDHPHRATSPRAGYLHEPGAGFVFTCKQNQPRLFAALDALPWAQTPVAARELDRDHGRITTRTIQVLPAPTDLPFPHVQQVWLIERHATDLDGTPRSAVARARGYEPARRSRHPRPPRRPGPPNWGIESLHWLRDTLYREDDSTVSTRSGPRLMASLRNLAVGAIRLTGRRDITETTRQAARNMTHPFKIFKLA